MNKFIALLISASFMAISAQAADAPKAAKTKAPKLEWTTEQRESMAKVHEGMATCLRSNKTMKECRAEMQTSCQEMGGNCPMMGRKGMHGGMMWEE